MTEAVTYLHSINDIAEFPTKIGRGPNAFLRPTCINSLKKLYALSQEEAEQAIDTFLGKEVPNAAAARSGGASSL